MKNTREKIIKNLLYNPGSTINDLAESVGINGISVRHHLNSLEANDLVTSSEERHGVGRPRLVYSLTDKGIEEFPTNYIRLAKTLINVLKENYSEDDVQMIFQNVGKSIAADYKKQFEGKSIDSQLKLLIKIMSNEGYVIDWRKIHGNYEINILNCPYLHVGTECPEICALDKALISQALSHPVEINTCITNGNSQCTFQIIPQVKEEKK
jgi:predicted ArsR family transcriptional regulator